MADHKTDALLIPQGMAIGHPHEPRADAVQRIGREALTPHELHGGLVYARTQNYPTGSPDYHLFVTRSPHDTLAYPPGHVLAGRSRYDWARRDDGVFLGTLRVEPEAGIQEATKEAADHLRKMAGEFAELRKPNQADVSEPKHAG